MVDALARAVTDKRFHAADVRCIPSPPPEHTAAVSILDRLPRHATAIVTDGECVRMCDARHHRKDTTTNQHLRLTEEAGIQRGHQRDNDMAIDAVAAAGRCAG